MRILFIGDIVGKSGRETVINSVADLKKKYKPDFIIANGENAAHGKGISSKIYYQLIAAGINCITLGNHAFSKEIIKNSIDELANLIRPVNLIPNEYGQGYKVYKVLDKQLCVVNLCGTIFMDRVSHSPFTVMDNILNKVHADYYLVDFHGEASSEKIAFAYNYKDRIHAVIGTHTHVQTADERIIGKLAFITDVGMSGPYESIIGRDIDEVIKNMVHQEKTKFEVAVGPAVFQGVVIDLNDDTNKARKIERIQIRPKE